MRIWTASICSLLILFLLAFNGRVEAAPCGYPDKVRDGLHPYQYFALAKVYLGDFNLEMAKLCIQKLKRCKPSNKEISKLASILEDCYIPKHPVPAEAVEQLRKAMDIVKTERNSKEMQTIRKDLISKYPDFEWPYFLVSSDANSQVDEELRKILSINSNNVEALARLANSYSEKDLEKKLLYAKKAKELDPAREDIDLKSYKRTEIKVDPEHARKMTELANSCRETKFVQKAYKFIDKSGKNAFYVGPNVSTAKAFSDGLLLVELSHESRQFWNKSGDLAFDVNATEALNASEGLCAIRPQNFPDGSRWGFVDHQGKSVIASKYLGARAFHDGMAAVKVFVGMRNHMSSKDMWGFINSQDEIQIEPIYDHCFSFKEGLAAVAINGKIGFIDKEGYFVIPPKYDCARPFSEGLANVIYMDQEKQLIFDQYIKPDGKIAFSMNYKIEKGKKLAEILSISHYLSPEHYEFQTEEKFNYRWFDFHDGLTARWLEIAPKVWKIGFRGKKGPFEIAPKFDSAEAFSEGLSKVKVAEKFGYINTKGELIIPAAFKSATDFSDGLAAVSTNGETWGYIDKTGKLVIDEIYLEANPFSEGLAKVGVAK